MTTDKQLAELARLETVISRGLAAYDERNRLIADLVEQGIKQAEVTRRLNAVRSKVGVATLGPCAVAAVMRRVEKEASEASSDA